MHSLVVHSSFPHALGDDGQRLSCEHCRKHISSLAPLRLRRIFAAASCSGPMAMQAVGASGEIEYMPAYVIKGAEASNAKLNETIAELKLMSQDSFNVNAPNFNWAAAVKSANSAHNSTKEMLRRLLVQKQEAKSAMESK